MQQITWQRLNACTYDRLRHEINSLNEDVVVGGDIGKTHVQVIPVPKYFDFPLRLIGKAAASFARFLPV